ncbi:MAG: hypothetical protein ABIP37_01125 [Methylotenera sp.]
MKNMLFDKFSKLISEKNIAGLDDRILLDKEGALSVFYTPFDHVNIKAKIVLVGITPGPTQMNNAMKIAHSYLSSGATNEEAQVAAKMSAAFSGEPMRGNLIKQLNDWAYTNGS